MKADFWHERWERNQIGFHQTGINSHLQDFWGKLSVRTGATVFVPLCGKSSDLLWLRAQGYQVVGIELSPIAVRDFFTGNQLEATVTTQGKFECWEANGLVIYLGDFFDLTPADLSHCSAVFDRASLIALPPDMRPQYATQLQSITPKGSPVLLVTLEYDQSIANGPPFSVSEAEVQQYYGQRFSIECLRTTDVLDELPGLKKRGVPAIDEKAYLMLDRDA